jgi:hypothetical protein
MARERASQAHWDVASYRWDFDSSDASFWVLDGWWTPERRDDSTFAWADGKPSRLWVFFPQRYDVVLELGLSAFIFPGCHQQGIKVYVNERFLGEIEVDAAGWRSYALRVPQNYLTPSVNVFRFV